MINLPTPVENASSLPSSIYLTQSLQALSLYFVFNEIPQLTALVLIPILRTMHMASERKYNVGLLKRLRSTDGCQELIQI